MHLLLPLIAAVAFAFGSIVFKRAFREGAGVVHAVVVNNVALGILFLPLLLLETRPIPWDQLHRPFITALAFVVGHLLNVVSLRVGDVSVATPLLGSKIIFVALAGWFLFGVELGGAQWTAAVLATVGVAVMGFTDVGPGRRRGLTTATALGCAAAFALTDLTIQVWGSDFGTFSYLALQFAALGLLSLLVLPVFGVASLRAPRSAWRWIALAALLSGLQAVLVTGTISVWRDAAGTNIVYATRGLWSIVLVWFLGRWLRNDERQTAGARRMGVRLVGGGLILSAVFLAVRAGNR